MNCIGAVVRISTAAFPDDIVYVDVNSNMAMLARFQDENGMWRNVIDRPGAYPEYSATAMIATAMLRGIRKGWLDPRVYQPLVDQAWQAIQLRTGADGQLVDVCESTGTRGMTVPVPPGSSVTVDMAGVGSAIKSTPC